MDKFEQQYNFELSPDTLVQIVASLEDKYFLKTDKGQYFFLDSNLAQYEKVTEEAVASAIIKHGYKPIDQTKRFKFGEIKNILNKIK
jgi:heterodisulfide reductase subunit A-like polyferredoxin